MRSNERPNRPGASATPPAKNARGATAQSHSTGHRGVKPAAAHRAKQPAAALTGAVAGPKMSSTSSSVEHTAPAAPLSLEALLYLVPMDATPESMQALDLSGRNISSLPAQLKAFQGIRKMLLVNNALSSLENLSSLRYLSHLNVSNNHLVDLKGLMPLTGLVVLQVSNNRLTSLTGIEGSRDSLKALIVNDNKLTLMSKNGSPSPLEVLLRSLTSIETIVLSRNPLLSGYTPPAVSDDEAEQLATVGEDGTDGSAASKPTTPHPLDVFAELPKLKKVSLSECQIPSLPRRWFLPMAVEVRLAQNQISSFPEGVIFRSAHTLDVSSNAIADLTQLRRCKYLQNLSVRGNPFAPAPVSTSSAAWWSDYRTHMIVGRMFQQLRVLDGSKFTPLSKEDYLAKKSENSRTVAPSSATAEADEGSSSSNAPLGATDATDAKKRSRSDDLDDAPDVVLEVPQDTVASTGRAVVRRQRAVADQQISRNTKAIGVAALELLKKRQSQPSGGW